MVLDPMSMRARGCGPFEGLLHMPSVGTQKKWPLELGIWTQIEWALELGIWTHIPQIWFTVKTPFIPSTMSD